MKKFLFALLSILVLTSGLTNANASEKITVKVNGEVVKFDTEPYIDNGRTMVPIRFISEALGAKVDWNGTYRLVTITFDETKIEQKIGKTVAIVNNQEVTFDVPAIIKNDRTMVPVRFVSEALGANVEWEATTKTVIITTKKEDSRIPPTSTPVNIGTPIGTEEEYNPSKWVKVVYDGEEVELDLTIPWNEQKKYMANCDYAESVIAKKYNNDIAKQVVDIARNKKERREMFRKTLQLNKKQIDVISSGSSISISFWKEGVTP